MRARQQRGVAALEFAIVLPLLLALLLGIAYYGLLLALEQALTLAAAEGARAALRYPGGAEDGSPEASAALRTAAAAQTALAALPDGVRTRLDSQSDVANAAACPSPADTLCISVTLRLAPTRILPALPLVPLPEQLVGRAVAQLDPEI